MKYCWLLLILCFAATAGAQAPRVRCTEKQRKSEDTAITDPVLRTTCYLRAFRFVETAFPDYAGRYIAREHAVSLRVKGRWVRSSNTRVFNNRQAALLADINRRIREEWKGYRSDPETKDCFDENAVLPLYGMNDLAISFQGNDIWFSVDWGLSAACRNVGGAI